MKKFLTGALVLALSVGAAQAQTTDKGQKKGFKKEHRMHGNMEKLNLTDAQKAELKSLREKQKAEMQALRSNTALSAEQSKAQRAELHKKYRSQYEAILTPEQKAEAKKMLEARQAKGNFRKGAAKNKARAGKMKSEMNFTPEQQEKMKQLRTEMKSKADAIKNNKELTEEQKKSQMQDLMKTNREQMKSILTKEQAEKMESRKKDRKVKNTK